MRHVEEKDMAQNYVLALEILFYKGAWKEKN